VPALNFVGMLTVGPYGSRHNLAEIAILGRDADALLGLELDAGGG
jgi:hypothetical protein